MFDLELFGEASGDFPCVNFLLGIPRLLVSPPPPMVMRPVLPLLPSWSGLARPSSGSGVRRGLRASGVDPRRGLSEALSTLPRLEPSPPRLPLLSVGDSTIS